ncbi:MAG: group 1 truncated hemoglobin [Gammaproteobacteria bacterium]|jgi:hemoglobin
MAQTIFDRNGGFAKINRVVMSFYDRVLDSPVMSPYFVATDMRRLIDHQTKFIAFLMGGPASFSEEHLAQVHRHLDIDRRAFDEMVSLLSETLEDFDFSDEDIATVEKELERRAPLIVTRS